MDEQEKPHSTESHREDVTVVAACGTNEERRNSEALMNAFDLDRRLSHSSTISTGARSGYESALSSPRSPNPIVFRIPEVASSLSRRTSALSSAPEFPFPVVTSDPSIPLPYPQWTSASLLLPTQLIASEMSFRLTSPFFTLSGRYRCLHCEFSSEERFLIQLHMVQLHADFINAPLDSLLGVVLPAASTAGSLPLTPPISSSQPMELHSWLTPAIGTASTSSASSSRQHVISPANLYKGARPIEASTSGSATATPADQVRCETCGKFLPKKKPLSSLLNHAKRHYLLKQFVCVECTYGSSEAAHVRNHMKLRHNIVGRDPLDVRNATLQDAWLRITARCFPTMSDELTRFRFKRFRKRNRKRIDSETDHSSELSSTSQHRSSNEDSSDSSPQPTTSGQTASASEQS